jgi:hypothetical protein
VALDASKLTQDVSKWLKMPQRGYARTAYNYQSGTAKVVGASAVGAFWSALLWLGFCFAPLNHM